MFSAILTFELKKRLGQISTWVYGVMFFGIGLLTTAATGGAFQGVTVGAGADKVHANAPVTLHNLIGVLSCFGVIVTAAVFGQAVHQDYEANVDALFFTLPIKKRSYLSGRFAGALVFMVGVLGALAVGMAAGTWFPGVDRSSFGPFQPAAYLLPYLTLVLPNLLLTGGLFFCLATLGRRMMPVYVGAVVLLIGYLLASSLTAKLENQTVAALVDPFGLSASERVTQYWTIVEQNTRLVPLTGVFLLNRLLWGGLGLALIAFTAWRFRFSTEVRLGGAPKARDKEVGAAPAVALPAAAVRPGGALGLAARMSWLQFRETVKSVYFLVIALAGVLFLVLVTRVLGSIFGTSTWPVSGLIAETLGGSFSLFLMILLTFYAGELVWRERDSGTAQMIDAMPIPTWTVVVSKLVALALVQVALFAVVMMAGLVVQAVQGYFHFELGVYVQELFGVQLWRFVLLAVLAITVQTLVNQKYIGHAAMVGYYLLNVLLSTRLGVEHHLLRYASTPAAQYSDMNGYAHALRPVAWFLVYWGGVAGLLVVVTQLFWMRGVDAAWKSRWKGIRARFTGAVRGWTALFLAVVLGCGGFIFYNTNLLNRYRTAHDEERLQARYEQRYKAVQKEPQPRVVSASVQIDLEPDAQNFTARGRYLLANKTGAPITTVYLNIEDSMTVRALTVAGQSATAVDSELGFHTFKLDSPIPPGESRPLDFDLAFVTRGFKNSGLPTVVVPNGTFIHSSYLPSVGYDERGEISEDKDRTKYDLPPKERMADLDDLKARMKNYVTPDADWTDFDITVSTTPDQIAIAPGYLQREWTEGGRRYFHYQMDTPVLHFFSVLSGRYEVMRDKWRDVALEIYYHPTHTYDLDAMMRGMKDTLTYASDKFSPYQFRQLRIIEFPRYQTFAQSFPNTVPFSEAIGFIAKVDPKDPDDVDYPYYVSAHETAHQWWAHQVLGGNVQGATVLSETLAQYTALMVMKHSVGEGQMRKFLKYELDRYLVGRTLERKKEVPLERVENQQYIHYQKGSLAMYWLQDVVGEEAIDRALAAFVAKNKYRAAPYPNARMLVDELAKVVPEDSKYLIHDLFETITLYDNRATEASAKKEADGWHVKLTVTSKKKRAGELGAEEEVPVDDWVEIGALDEKGTPLALQKVRMSAPEKTFELVVKDKPAKAGIDPLCKLIDRVTDDNVTKVTAVE